MVSITPEQVDALARSEDRCLHLRDPRTNKVYLLVEEGPVPEADAEHVEYMQRGLEQAERELDEGLGMPWDKNALLAELRARATSTLSSKPLPCSKARE